MPSAGVLLVPKEGSLLPEIAPPGAVGIPVGPSALPPTRWLGLCPVGLLSRHCARLLVRELGWGRGRRHVMDGNRPK